MALCEEAIFSHFFTILIENNHSKVLNCYPGNNCIFRQKRLHWNFKLKTLPLSRMTDNDDLLHQQPNQSFVKCIKNMGCFSGFNTALIRV